MKIKRVLSFCITIALFEIANINGADSAEVVGERVKFPGTTQSGEQLSLKGIINKLAGDGPFPAVVLLCGCGGLDRQSEISNANAYVLHKYSNIYRMP